MKSTFTLFLILLLSAFTMQLSSKTMLQSYTTPLYNPTFDIKIFPNPTTDWLNIELIDPLTEGQQVEMSIMNVIGSIITEQVIEFSNKQYKHHVGDLHPGMYLLVLETNGKKSVKKFKVN